MCSHSEIICLHSILTAKWSREAKCFFYIDDRTYKAGTAEKGEGEAGEDPETGGTEIEETTGINFTKQFVQLPRRARIIRSRKICCSVSPTFLLKFYSIF